jgi:hypothetical protein
MACYMAAAGVGAIIVGSLEGPSNNVARRAAKAADVGDLRRVENIQSAMRDLSGERSEAMVKELLEAGDVEGLPQMRAMAGQYNASGHGIDLIGIDDANTVYHIEVKGGPGTGAKMGTPSYGVQMSLSWRNYSIDQALENEALRDRLMQMTGIYDTGLLSAYLRGGQPVLIMPSWKKIEQIQNFAESGLTRQNVVTVP